MKHRSNITYMEIIKKKKTGGNTIAYPFPVSQEMKERLDALKQNGVDLNEMFRRYAMQVLEKTKVTQDQEAG